MVPIRPPLSVARDHRPRDRLARRGLPPQGRGDLLSRLECPASSAPEPERRGDPLLPVRVAAEAGWADPEGRARQGRVVTDDPRLDLEASPGRPRDETVCLLPIAHRAVEVEP